MGRMSSIVLLVLLAHGGCASATADSADRGTPIQVTDLSSVVGHWAGLSDLPGHRFDDQYIEVTLHDDGSYEATSARTVGVMDRRGRVQVRDGRLVIEGSDGATGTATLYSTGGQRTLLVQLAGGKVGNATARLRQQP